MSETVKLVRELIGINSENPTGSEKEIGNFVRNWFKSVTGLNVETYEALPNRANIVAVLKGDTDCPGLAYICHMDTVPVGDGWTRDPFGGIIENGRLYGRGSTDMKGGLAAAMIALKRAALSGKRFSKNFLVCATVDEEGVDMKGALDLAERKIVAKDTYLVACEPTGLRCAVEHKGVIWYELTMEGKASHAGNPRVGANAVYAAGEAMIGLKRMFDGLEADSVLVGRPTATFSRFEGGHKTNVVPDRARCEIDVRIPAPMTIRDVTEAMRAAIAAAVTDGRIKWNLRQFNIDRPPITALRDSPLTRALEPAFKNRMARSLEYFGLPAYTDASIIGARIGNPYGYLFGPGILELAHTADEYVPVDEVESAADILADLALNLLGKE
jgi:succinyl-diaminopimelate desuccinylase